MIFFSNLLESVSPCVFTEMLKILVVKAKSIMASTRLNVFCAKPISASDRPFKPYPTVRGTRLLYLETSQPEIGSPIREPTGMASKIVPSSASLNPKNSLIVGILEAQVAKLKPEIKKNRLRKKRCLLFETIEFVCVYF